MPRRGSTYDQSWTHVRLIVLRRDGYLCQIRGPKCRGTATDVDHIRPVSLGGARLDPSNLRAACATCNRGRALAPEVFGTASRRPSREW